MLARSCLVVLMSLTTIASARVAAAQAAVVDSTRVKWTTVTYLTGASVYLDAGTRAGLVAGSRVDVIRAGSAIAELVVEFVSSSRSSCRIVKSTSMPVIGDSARFVAVAGPAAASDTTVGSPAGVVAAGRAGRVTTSSRSRPVPQPARAPASPRARTTRG